MKERLRETEIIIRTITENDGVDLGSGEACREQAIDLVRDKAVQ